MSDGRAPGEIPRPAAHLHLGRHSRLKHDGLFIRKAQPFVTIAFGVYWFAQPPAPSWWPIDEQWWLFGGWPPGVTLVLSGMFAIGLIVYSYRRFRGSPYEEDEEDED